jgi:hypothetical protein
LKDRKSREIMSGKMREMLDNDSIDEASIAPPEVGTNRREHIDVGSRAAARGSVGTGQQRRSGDAARPIPPRPRLLSRDEEDALLDGAGRAATPRAGHGEAPQGRGARTPYEDAMEAATPDIRDQARKIKAEHQIPDQDYVWTILKVVLIPFGAAEHLPGRVEDAVNRALLKMSNTLGETAAKVNVVELGAGIVQAVARSLRAEADEFASRVGKSLDELQAALEMQAAPEKKIAPLRYGIMGAAVAILTLLVGIAIGRSIDLGGYREEYARRLATVRESRR